MKELDAAYIPMVTGGSSEIPGFPNAPGNSFRPVDPPDFWPQASPLQRVLNELRDALRL